MTCVVGIADGKTVWMGADSAMSDGWSIRESKAYKIFKSHGFLIGTTGSLRIRQLLQHGINYKELNAISNKYSDKLEFMIKEFIPPVRKIFKDNGFSEINNNVEKGGYFLVGFYGELYSIESNFQVVTSKPSYAAIGSGEYFALGSLGTTYLAKNISSSAIDPVSAIEAALMVSADLCATVRRPFHYLNIGEDDADN